MTTAALLAYLLAATVRLWTPLALGAMGGVLSEPLAVEVVAGAHVPDLRATLVAGASLDGVLLDAEGAPVVDALVLSEDEVTGATSAARSGPGGRFRLEGLVPGVLRLVFVAPGADGPDPLEPPHRATAPGTGFALRAAPRL